MNEIKRVVNENDDKAGGLDNLNTIDKTSLVDAINEVLSNLTDLISVDTSSNSGHITIGKIGIEWGTVSVTPENGYGASAVTFENTYRVSPAVIACAGVGTSTITNVGVFGVNSNGCSVFIVTTNTSARICRYLVIGEIA